MSVSQSEYNEIVNRNIEFILFLGFLITTDLTKHSILE